ncbi:MAG: D-alanyl-D-alanine carboxypeptidase [Alphaproteobacteria bacterium]|nr:D-alanyl-D-alanine carboxypeptidase [Alphaproteobacteria bacterium]|tara:strand:+ start:2901 stop:4058 length:1158 start_codon:yes stop_codon:yes gene_type:complete
MLNLNRNLIAPIMFSLIVLVALVQLPRAVSATETAAKYAFMMDFDTGAVLLEKNAEEPTAPASMSKLMTLYMIFERLKSGGLRLEDTFPVSEKAWRMGGSKMFVGVNTRVKLEDLLRGIVVQSGNDACIVIAEGLAQHEAAFAEEMTERARELGLANSTFVNSTGWPDPDHLMSVKDIATISASIIREFPEYYPLFAEKTYTYNDIKQGNRNPLLYRYDGADGLKTGHTEASGYGLAASVNKRDRRLILVVNGLQSQKQRAQETERLFDWAFREFDNYALFTAGETVENADVWLGQEGQVPLIIRDDVKLTLPRKARRKMEVKVAYNGPVAAPVRAGEELAIVTISAPDQETLQIPLVAGKDVPRLGMFGRLSAAFKYLAWGAEE